MPQKGEIANGARIQQLRGHVSQAELAFRTGISERALRNAEGGNPCLRGKVLEPLAAYFNVPLWSLIQHPPNPYLDRRSYYANGKPFDALSLFGWATDFLTRERVHIHYDSAAFKSDLPLPIPREEWLTLQKQRDEELFDGSVVRLTQFSHDVVQGPGAVLERRMLDLHLGPLGWFDYITYNKQLMGKIEPNDYEAYLGLSQILDYSDFRRSKLPSIMSCAVTIVTQDRSVGYMIRGKKLSSVSGRLSSAIAENVNRYLDETLDDGETLAHPDDAYTLPLRKTPPDYHPPAGNVPHPFATVRRGLWREVSPGILEHVRPNAIKLTGISYTLEEYQPDALFIVFVDCPSKDVQRLRSEWKGEEYDEGQIEFVKADFADPTTQAVLDDPRWCAGGKASLVRAIELIRTLELASGGRFNALETLAEAD